MTHYALYDKETGTLISVGKVLPNPLPDDQAYKTYPDLPPHATFWDPATRDYLIPLEIPQEMKGKLQAFVRDDHDVQLALFLGWLKRSRPSLDPDRAKLALTRTLSGRMTLDDYTLLESIPELNPGAALTVDAQLNQLVARLEKARREGRWNQAQSVQGQIETMGYHVVFHPDGTITVRNS